MPLTKAQVIEKLTELWTEAGQKSNTNTYQHGRRVALGIALNLVSELEEVAPVPTLKDLAETLHEKLCRWDHTDQCTWWYENDWEKPAHNPPNTPTRNRWDQWAHRDYLERATQLSTKTELPTETLIKVISNL